MGIDPRWGVAVGRQGKPDPQKWDRYFQSQYPKAKDSKGWEADSSVEFPIASRRQDESYYTNKKVYPPHPGYARNPGALGVGMSHTTKGGGASEGRNATANLASGKSFYPTVGPTRVSGGGPLSARGYRLPSGQSQVRERDFQDGGKKVFIFSSEGVNLCHEAGAHMAGSSGDQESDATPGGEFVLEGGLENPRGHVQGGKSPPPWVDG